MNIFKHGIIVFALSLFAVSTAHAKSENLPFVGSAVVNWLGGNATNEFITIKKNGTVTITSETLDGNAFYVYQGKFSNPLKITEKDGSFYYYQFNDKNTISLLDENKKVMTSCSNSFGETEKCTQEIMIFDDL